MSEVGGAPAAPAEPWLQLAGEELAFEADADANSAGPTLDDEVVPR